MALITMPASPKPRRLSLRLEQPSQVNSSEFTGRTQAVRLASFSRWLASVEMPPMKTEADVRAWRAFLISLEGRFNTFRLPVTEGSQGLTTNTVRVNGAGQTGYGLATDGWPASYTGAKAGHFFTLENRLYTFASDPTVNASGQATLSIRPHLAIAPADNAILEINNPYAVMSLASDQVGWSVDPGRIYGFSLECEERY